MLTRPAAVARLSLVAAALGVATAPAPARAVEGVTGRVFVLSETMAAPIAVAPDGTIYGTGAADRGGLLRLRPRDAAGRAVEQQIAPTDLAVEPGGTVLVTEDARLWRWSPAGTLTAVAGAGPDDEIVPPEQAEGAPARNVLLCPAAVAPLPGGAVAIGERNGVLRSVGPDGLLTTLAVPGALDWSPGWQCASTAGPEIRDLALAPDGRLLELLAPAHRSDVRIDARSPDGTTEPLYAGRMVSSIAVARDGSLLLAHWDRVLRWRPGSGRSQVVARLASGEEEPDLSGAPALGIPIYPAAAAEAPDGGLLIAGDREDPVLAYVAPAHPRRTAVATIPVRGRVTPATVRVPLRATRSATARLAVADLHGHVVARTTAPVRAGIAAITLRSRVRPGTYEVRVALRSADGQQASDSYERVLGGVLTFAHARRLLVPERVDLEACPYVWSPGARAADCLSNWTGTTSAGCRRLGARRVECVYAYRDGRVARCMRAAARVTDDGRVVTADEQVPCQGGTPRRPAAPLPLPLDGSTRVGVPDLQPAAR